MWMSARDAQTSHSLIHQHNYMDNEDDHEIDADDSENQKWLQTHFGQSNGYLVLITLTFHSEFSCSLLPIYTVPHIEHTEVP